MKRLLLLLCLLFACSTLLSRANAAPKEPSVVVKAETLSGTLAIVNQDEKIIYLKAPDGIMYDFHVTSATTVLVGGQKVKFDDLSGKIGSEVEVTFRALHTGNMASKVEIK